MNKCSRSGCLNTCKDDKEFCQTCVDFVHQYNMGELPSSVPYELGCLSGMTWVYFIGSPSHEFIKIGRAQDVRKRLSGIAVSSPHELNVLASFFTFSQVEKMLHIMFIEQHERGEWFRENDELLKLIDRLSGGDIPEFLYYPKLLKGSVARK